MFGMGMGEIVLIAVVALLVLGPDRLPAAAKSIGKGIRDLRKQTQDLQRTVEDDTELGDAVRELRSALRGDPEHLYNKLTATDADKPESDEPPRYDAEGHPLDDEGHRIDEEGHRLDEHGVPLHQQFAELGVPGISHQANRDDESDSQSNDKGDDAEQDPDLPVIRTPPGALSRSDSDPSSDA
jgi:sec-independent protein translocase protein TatB